VNISVMSLNILYSRGKDGGNSWPNRKTLVGDLIKSHQSDFIGFQEQLQYQMDDLVHMQRGWMVGACHVPWFFRYKK
jgi:hypothetical protein